MRRRAGSRELAAGGTPEDGAQRAFVLALRALGRRPRTAVELATFLERRWVAEAVVEDTLRRLRDLGYLDEAAVAEAAVREAERRHLGSRRVAQGLARRGTPDIHV